MIEAEAEGADFRTTEFCSLDEGDAQKAAKEGPCTMQVESRDSTLGARIISKVGEGSDDKNLILSTIS
jgi:hypothetical protein